MSFRGENPLLEGREILGLIVRQKEGEKPPPPGFYLYLIPAIFSFMRLIWISAGVFLLVFLCGCLEPAEFPAYNQSKNYCGPEGKFSGPNKHLLSGASFNYACYHHDKCYHECSKPENTQKSCDDAFLKRMDEACEEHLAIQLEKCKKESDWKIVQAACRFSVKTRMATCPAQARTYWGIVAGGGKAIGAYTCED